VRAANPDIPYKIVPVELDTLAVAVETSMLAITIRHIEVRSLFQKILDCVSNRASLSKFRTDARRIARDWQKEVLESEKRATLAVKSYGVMLGTGRQHVGVFEIEAGLAGDASVKRYFQALHAQLAPKLIADSLLSESLGKFIQKLPTNNEDVFCPVPLSDFKSRCARRQAAVEAAHANKPS
jgi:hypothetical protein